MPISPETAISAPPTATVTETKAATSASYSRVNIPLREKLTLQHNASLKVTTRNYLNKVVFTKGEIREALVTTSLVKGKRKTRGPA